jgi:hypothetical protein
MCAILGWLDRTRPRPTHEPDSVAPAAAHRAPDGRGAFLASAARLALGQDRSSSIDLSPGGNPGILEGIGEQHVLFAGVRPGPGVFAVQLRPGGRSPVSSSAGPECQKGIRPLGREGGARRSERSEAHRLEGQRGGNPTQQGRLGSRLPPVRAEGRSRPVRLGKASRAPASRGRLLRRREPQIQAPAPGPHHLDRRPVPAPLEALVAPLRPAAPHGSLRA